jgi:DNA helicase HerA-like ATPase
MSDPLIIGKNAERSLGLLPAFANRHGCITGATGSGKTVTLQVLAENFSRIGVPVFMADVKGDLAGICKPGTPNGKIQSRLESLQVAEHRWSGFPVTLWDLWGERGHPIRATVSDMGPLLLASLMGLNETQAGVLSIVFKVADDNDLLLLDLKDLRAILHYVGSDTARFKIDYGNVSTASIGAIQRGLLQIEQQGGAKFFGEPMLDISDLMQIVGGRGVVNILDAEKLMSNPRVYSCFLLWLLAELFENLPEVGDLEKPKLVFFFDEAHLLFSEAQPALLQKIEQVVRLIRSKGVGVYFVTQNPLDIPDTILGQLGNRIQHTLRAFTPRDQRAVAAVADTMRPNPKLNIKEAIVELAVGEALMSFLDLGGSPTVTERLWVIPPTSSIGPILHEERKALMSTSSVAGVYDEAEDRDSAYEVLRNDIPADNAPRTPKKRPRSAKKEPEDMGFSGLRLSDLLFGSTGPRGIRRAGLVDTVARELSRGLLGSLIRGRKRR